MSFSSVSILILVVENDLDSQRVFPSCRQTKLDCELLEDEGIMDYSLMLGLQVKGSCHGELSILCFSILIISNNKQTS